MSTCSVVPGEEVRTWAFENGFCDTRCVCRVPGACHQRLFLTENENRSEWLLGVLYKQGCFCLIFLVFVFLTIIFFK